MVSNPALSGVRSTRLRLNRQNRDHKLPVKELDLPYLNRRWVFPIALALFIGIILIGCKKREKTADAIKNVETQVKQSGKESPEEGFLAPGFTLPSLSGSPVNLSDFKGKVVLLNFWATWCGPCKKEIPALKRLYQAKRGPGFEILAVSLDRTSGDKVASFVKANQMEFPILLNPEGDIGGKYWVRGIPTTFLLDKQGVIKFKAVGGREWDGTEILNQIDQLLSE
jgi:cytochrome c biogenesis protein CcmG/thiol:disulfide interchange protein DsbE